MPESNGFEWTEEPVEVGVSVNVPAIVGGSIEKRKVRFLYRCGMSEFSEAYKSALFSNGEDNAALASMNALHQCFERFCLSITGPGFDGKTLEESKKLVNGHGKLREAAQTSAGIVSRMFRVEEVEAERPLFGSAS